MKYENDWTLADFLYLHRNFSIASSQEMTMGSKQFADRVASRVYA